MNNHKLNYTLADFSGERKIIIPDMQREYCWASAISENNGKTLVENFLKGLLSSENIQLGLLYGYESPRDQIQLCDGQQRITTLYLLVGIIYRITEDNDVLRNKLRKILISDYELHEDDHEPRLQYAIRESTLFFLRDLVWFYFLGNKISADDGADNIRIQNWYFSEYDLDPTITNMLKAIDIMTPIVRAQYEQFIDMIAERINFMIFDMRDRRHGEEQFVVLNTTGKPLTITENLKPVLLGHFNDPQEMQNGEPVLKYYADLWEKWEQFFWENRPNDHLIADTGLNEFFRWIFIMEHSKNQPTSTEAEKYTEAQKALTGKSFDLCSLFEKTQDLLECIEQYFQTLNRLIGCQLIKDRFLFPKESLTQIDCFQFLPILQYAMQFPELDVNGRFMLRVIKFFESRSMIDNISKSSVLNVFHALGMVRELKNMVTEDIAQIINSQNSTSSTILDDVEKFKFRTFLSAINRNAEEDAIWHAERLKCCKGNILYLFDILELDIASVDTEFDLTQFQLLTEILENTLETPNDLLRRALLSRGDYSCWHGNTPMLSASRYTLGNNADFFRKIVQDDENMEKANIILNIMKELLNSKDEKIVDIFERIIKAYTPSLESLESAWGQARNIMICNPAVLKKMVNKLFAISYDEQYVYGLTQQKVTGEHTYFKIAEKILKNEP